MQNAKKRAVPTGETAVDETRARILSAAAQVFAAQGYARATTRALAAAAGVNEVTLFRRFGNKQGLFAAVIDRFAAPAMTAEMEAQLSGDLRLDLGMMARALAGLMVQREGAVRMMLCESAHFPELREVLVKNPRQLRQMLASYLKQRMEDGQVRPMHAEATAQAFWGMFFAYGISLGILDESLSPAIDLDELVDHFVDIFVNGIAA